MDFRNVGVKDVYGVDRLYDLYIIMVLSLSISGYLAYWFIAKIGGLWKGISTFFLKHSLAFNHTGIP
jgi:hypothetical protein